MSVLSVMGTRVPPLLCSTLLPSCTAHRLFPQPQQRRRVAHLNEAGARNLTEVMQQEDPNLWGGPREGGCKVWLATIKSCRQLGAVEGM